ncbi:MAG: Gmad2 immunoglobulin-like domain-containing protein [Candidatus Pacebacteria bacterium]|nr:Gmad2 immunoglobulin-like domain-containing protein [Candidatus Paceibacterota bacterium]
MRKLLQITAAAVFITLIFFVVDLIVGWSEESRVTTFEECVEAGNPVMESYPRQCRTRSGEHFIEYIGNELEKVDLIRISAPRPNGRIVSPLEIAGEARGYWFFEASFPVVLTDWDGRIIAEHYAEANGEWMTEGFVPFESTLEFERPYDVGDPEFMKRGTLILKRHNASGLQQYDDALEIPVVFE